MSKERKPPMQIAILTISDRCFRGEAHDESGPAINSFFRHHFDAIVQRQAIVPDLKDEIAQTLIQWADSISPDIILTTGGTGFSKRDVTPEATMTAIERQAPGLAEAMRMQGLEKTPHAMLSRATAGIRGRTLIINLPGSPKAVSENLEAIAEALPHAVSILRGDPDTRHAYHK